MKKITSILLSIATVAFLANWSEKTSVEGRKKHSINFHGILTTYQGNVIKVDNISIDRLFKQIPVYEKPRPPHVDLKTHELQVNPKKGLIKVRIDLSETREILIPHPDIAWTHKRKKGGRKVNYLELIVISNDRRKTKNHYLIESRKKIYCDGISDAGPKEMDVPLTAVKSLTIGGYTHRDTAAKKPTNKKARKTRIVKKEK